MSTLAQYSIINVYGIPIVKYDLIGVVLSYGLKLFDVYRRYNSSHSIMIHDARNNHIYFHKNYTIHQSIQQILLLTHSQTRLLSVYRSYSIKDALTIHPPNLLYKYWFDIQEIYQTIIFEIAGLPMMGSLAIELDAIELDALKPIRRNTSEIVGNKRKFNKIDEQSEEIPDRISIYNDVENEQNVDSPILNNVITSIQAM